ncbi:MAG TPA: polysaccharide deacetylase family protein [Usitatibacteraceae bacterium]|nr:polysaccharide deacetylase family protein [Usitatibacteraceae bacterium]
MPRVAVPVLAYHAMNVAGPGYGENDHAAFAADLELLHGLGARIVPLSEVARAAVEGRLDALAGCVALSLDDGADFDARDVPHPVWGPQRGMLGILRDFRSRHGAAAQPGLHATAFAIVSPEARAELDRRHMVGCGWWSDGWWREAEATGLLAVESHSWDHNQATLATTAARAPKGAFDLSTREDADAEIARATRYLRERRGRDGEVLFAYPYGPASDYLANEYLPDPAAGHGVFAAFTTDGAPVTPGASRWRLPRFVCGWHWKAPGELERLMAGCGIRRRSGLLSRLLGRGRQAPATSAPEPAGPATWRECLRTWEVNDARVLAGELFSRSFGGQPVPDYPRHFVLVHSPSPGEPDAAPRVVAYMHHTPHEGIHLSGGMCVDAAAYRAMPRWLYGQVRAEGGLATLIARESIAMLGESPAAFGHVGEPRARAADLRAGFVDTGRPHLMAVWRKALPEEEKRRLVDLVEALGPF